MLELIFAAALMDTVIAPMDFGTVYVHEWGAVTFTEENVIFGANPLTDPNSDFIPPYPSQWEEPVARAPIVYFYGAQFSGTFTVSVHSGNFIETLPFPESLTNTSPMPPPQSYNAVWEIWDTTQNQEYLVEEYYCVSSDMLETWREPPSYVLEFSDGSQEKFVYYECALQPSSEDDFYPVLLRDNGAVLDPAYSGTAMWFVKEGETVVLDRIMGDDPLQGIITPNGPQNIYPEILCDWAGGTMKSAELVSMWDTWEGWIFDGSWSGDTLLVFPFPGSTIEGMTTIDLRTNEYHSVEYSRFYLGILSY
ncbi:MAG: hypothetical protein KAR44_11540 [Candidatus Aegiribacteria sp.]|nr:hypothetical protein [Candidatus Aegiribacteria sp.]